MTGNDEAGGYWRENLSRLHGPLELGLTVLGFLLLALSRFVEAGLHEELEWWGTMAFGLVVPLVFVLVINPAQMWAEAQEQLSAYAASPVTVEAAPLTAFSAAPLGGTAAYPIRLRVTNRGTLGGHYYAQVIAVAGQMEPGPEPPWWVPWRHSTERVTLIPPESSECLRVALLRAVDSAPHFELLEREGSEPRAHLTANEGAGVPLEVSILIREAELHQVVARVLMTIAPGEQENVPFVLSLSDLPKPT